MRQTRAEAVERTAAGGYRVRAGGEWMEADHVIVAAEAHSGGMLLPAVDARVAELLGKVGYSSTMTVAVGYNAADFEQPPSGFGFLIPKKERKRLVACTWVGTKFSYRVPEGMIVARCALGGTADPGVLKESDASIEATIQAELREIAGVTAKPRFMRIARWPNAMAQYTVGHTQREAELEARLGAIPGLYVAGNAYQGIGIPDCIRMGRTAAEKILGKG